MQLGTLEVDHLVRVRTRARARVRFRARARFRARVRVRVRVSLEVDHLVRALCALLGASLGQRQA